jgi:hypothetical protein
VSDLNSFSLAWRFTDPKFAVLPSEILQTIEPLDKQEARVLWTKYVYDEFDHLLKIPAKYVDKLVVSERRFVVDWHDPQDGIDKLRANVPLSDPGRIIVFWSPSVAVRTTWQTTTDYWTDFFYPDDDNCAVVFPDDFVRLLYVNEAFRVQRLKSWRKQP